MGKLNLAVNRLLEREEVFADLINGTVFNGKQVLHSGQLKKTFPQSGVFERKEDGKLAALERTGDVRMEAEFETYSVLFANETQAGVHYAMPVRNMLYDALEYVKQIQDKEKEHKEKGEKLTGNEFLSGMKKEDHLKPVVTTILYTGEEWDGAKSLYDLLEMDTSDERVEELKGYIPEYRINLIHAGNIENPGKFKTCLQHIFNMLKYRKDKDDMKNYIESHKTEISAMDQVEKMAAFVLLGEQKRVEKMLSESEEKGEVDMCQAIEEMIEDGRVEGRMEGRKEGRKFGEEIKLIKQVCKKLKKQFSLERITEELEEERPVIQRICDTAVAFAPDYDWEKVYQAMQVEG